MKFESLFFLLVTSCAGAYGQVVTTIAGTGEPGYSGDGGMAIHAQFDEPRHLDTNNVRVRKMRARQAAIEKADDGAA